MPVFTRRRARAEAFLSVLPAGERAIAAQLWATIALECCNTNPEMCMTSATRALGEARNCADESALSVALTSYAHALLLRGSIPEAADALTAHDERVRPNHRSRFLHATAWALSGDYDAAATFFGELRAVLLSAGDVTEAAVCAQNHAESEHWRGNTAKAVVLVREAVDAFRAGNDRVSVILCLSNLCGYLAALERLKQAKKIGKEALREGARSYPEIYSMTTAIEHLALLDALDGQHEIAARLAGYAEAAYAPEGYRREQTERATQSRLAALLRANPRYSELVAYEAAGRTMSADDAIALCLAR